MSLYGSAVALVSEYLKNQSGEIRKLAMSNAR